MWVKIITIKITKDLNYFSLYALNLFNTQISQFELNYWNKWTFPRHSNLLRCTCILVVVDTFSKWTELFPIKYFGNKFSVDLDFLWIWKVIEAPISQIKFIQTLQNAGNKASASHSTTPTILVLTEHLTEHWKKMVLENGFQLGSKPSKYINVS